MPCHTYCDAQEVLARCNEWLRLRRELIEIKKERIIQEEMKAFRPVNWLLSKLGFDMPLTKTREEAIKTLKGDRSSDDAFFLIEITGGRQARQVEELQAVARAAGKGKVAVDGFMARTLYGDD